MPKKKNSFSFFLDHYVDEQRRKGRNISKRLASEECGPLWKELPDEKKQIFLDLADVFRNKQGFRKQNTSNQCSDPFFQANDALDEEKPEFELSYLAAHIRHEKALRKHCFYIIHINYYCRMEEAVYLPAEMALAKFNLEDGISKTYHTLINPGKIPLGYAYEVRRVIDEVHGLPYPPHSEGESNLKQILTEMLHFMESSKEEEEYPPLFTVQENVQSSNEILKQLSERENFQSNLRVFPIHRMFFWLKNKCTEYCGNYPAFPVLSNAITEIEKDVFRYCTGISCKFHSDLPDKFQNCSLSIVQRLVYVICDHCCRHLKIKLIRGKHVHENVRKSTSDSSQKSLPCDASDVTSVAYEESDFCGASTYASSIVGDNAYGSAGTNFNEEEEEEEEDFPIVKGLLEFQMESDSFDDLCLATNRGRGRRIERVEREIGVHRC